MTILMRENLNRWLRYSYSVLRKPRNLNTEERELQTIVSSSARVADICGYPKMWTICPHCGQHSWRFPPHGVNEPCPIIVSAVDSAGLKLDAERNTAIRMGAQMDEVTRFMREHFGGQEDENDE